ncbi:alanine racemase [Thalassotalea sp. LPB0316]|uniref:alanine racemase n=1 Tax=Thalassotalea sp. LPB0316 TaxID=2769490 RepID=UPI0039B02325
MRTATVHINLPALVDNYQVIKTMAPKAKVLAVLKANGYGHGLVTIAKALPQADAFGVARIEEALELRTAGVIKPIVLLEGVFNTGDLAILAANNLQTIVHTKEQLHAILTADLDRPLKVWLKIDTGMHRLGIEPEQFNAFYYALTESENVHSDLVLMSHFSCADDLQSSSTQAQFSLFNQLTEQLPNARSIANSAGICGWQNTQCDWIRPGLMLYGVSPLIDKSSASFGLKPVMTLQSSVIAIQRVKKGETVGYGNAWQASEDTNIGVIAIGYGDGYPRHAQNGTPVWLNDRRVPLAGRVSMDMITVDLGPKSTDKIGDIATLWGSELPVEEIAKHSTTIAYELLCNITRRVKYI